MTWPGCIYSILMPTSHVTVRLCPVLTPTFAFSKPYPPGCDFLSCILLRVSLRPCLTPLLVRRRKHEVPQTPSATCSLLIKALCWRHATNPQSVWWGIAEDHPTSKTSDTASLSCLPQSAPRTSARGFSSLLGAFLSLSEPDTLLADTMRIATCICHCRTLLVHFPINSRWPRMAGPARRRLCCLIPL